MTLIEIFKAQALKRVLSGKGINCVLDIGANRGQYARMLRQLGYQGLIVSFEPNREAFARLSDVCSGDPNWKGVNVALGKEEGEMPFFITQGIASCSSFLKIKDEKCLDRTERIEIRRLDHVLADSLQEIREPRIFLKMDTQGFDLEVFHGAEGLMPVIFGLESEISVRPIYENMVSYLESLKVYEQFGFSLVDLFPVTQERAYAGVIEYDCLMVKEEADGTSETKR